MKIKKTAQRKKTLGFLPESPAQPGKTVLSTVKSKAKVVSPAAILKAGGVEKYATAKGLSPDALEKHAGSIPMSEREFKRALRSVD
ncbi:hypothetical protein SAMN05421823_102328 [Catalinimonas alkaloidigena]|uniref:Uncharacterized protein n=1 Tax=Catalinimonas alkaloidigena TaxID=1075417 RepID=A0A1G9AK00_9BACT|nr:hypothetical protein [Catalinimonas alkaloidigena]SDK27672.1 hypothetical protein SAMN05421823_102328 [Catalinimonas alkaloidigena]